MPTSSTLLPSYAPPPLPLKPSPPLPPSLPGHRFHSNALTSLLRWSGSDETSPSALYDSPPTAPSASSSSHSRMSSALEKDPDGDYASAGSGASAAEEEEVAMHLSGGGKKPAGGNRKRVRKPPGAPPAKRGRKRKDDDEIHGSDPEQVEAAKRKSQNRTAQRAFRERKERHVKDLEDRLAQQDEQLTSLKTLVDRLTAENNQLRAGSGGQANLNTASPTPPSQSAALQPLDKPIDLSAGLYEFDVTTSPDDPSTSIPLPPLFESFFAPSFFPDSVSAVSHNQSVEHKHSHRHSHHLGTTSAPCEELDELDSEDGADGRGDGAEDLCPLGDEADPPTTGNRIPCDKPECDFSSVSCALPVPWRPPPLGDEKGRGEKDTWVCNQAWGKLCSHPLFGMCDVDELCHELRDKTRCSDDGRLVIFKSDVCDIFRTIPARARARQESTA